LVLAAEPATGANSLVLLDSALGALHDSPILTVGATTASITLTQLSANELGAILRGIRDTPAAPW